MTTTIRHFPLIAYAMHVGAYSWICARASVLPGVDIGEGAVLGLGSVATRDLEPWTVYAGVPAVKVKERCGRGHGRVISVLVLTKNEEQDLPGCLASVSWSDDVHVFDSLSTDATVKIAREGIGAKVTQRDFDNWSAHQQCGARESDRSDIRGSFDRCGRAVHTRAGGGDARDHSDGERSGCRLPGRAAGLFKGHLAAPCTDLAVVHPAGAARSRRATTRGESTCLNCRDRWAN